MGKEKQKNIFSCDSLFWLHVGSTMLLTVLSTLVLCFCSVLVVGSQSFPKAVPSLVIPVYLDENNDDLTSFLISQLSLHLHTLSSSLECLSITLQWISFPPPDTDVHRAPSLRTRETLSHLLDSCISWNNNQATYGHCNPISNLQYPIHLVDLTTTLERSSSITLSPYVPYHHIDHKQDIANEKVWGKEKKNVPYPHILSIPKMHIKPRRRLLPETTSTPSSGNGAQPLTGATVEDPWICQSYWLYLSFVAGCLVTLILVVSLRFVLGDHDSDIKDFLEKIVHAG